MRDYVRLATASRGRPGMHARRETDTIADPETGRRGTATWRLLSLALVKQLRPLTLVIRAASLQAVALVGYVSRSRCARDPPHRE